MNIEILKQLVDEHGVQGVIGELSNIVKNKEDCIREESNCRLGLAFDYLVTTLVQVMKFYKIDKRSNDLMKSTILSLPVIESMKIRKADSERQSVAMREANEYIKSLR